MKKVKVKIMEWLGVNDAVAQMENQIAHLEAKVEEHERELELVDSSLGEKIESYEVMEYVDIDMRNYDYEINEVIDDWIRENIDGVIDNRMDIIMSRLADEDTIREIVCTELDSHPFIQGMEDNPENTTWDMNEIVQEVISVLIDKLS